MRGKTTFHIRWKLFFYDVIIFAVTSVFLSFSFYCFVNFCLLRIRFFCYYTLPENSRFSPDFCKKIARKYFLSSSHSLPSAFQGTFNIYFSLRFLNTITPVVPRITAAPIQSTETGNFDQKMFYPDSRAVL